jgi:hypothetical protein
MTDNEKFVVKRMNAEEGLAAPRFYCSVVGCLNQPSHHGARICRDHERAVQKYMDMVMLDE